MGWPLLIDNDHHLSLFHPSTGQRLPLPHDSRRMPTLPDFIFRFASPPPDCHVVAIHMSDGFSLVCRRPGFKGHWSRGRRFPVEQDVFDAVLCNDKIYAASKSYVMAIDADMTCFPLEYLHANSSIQKNNLVESDGQLYMVWQSTLYPHEFGVCRWAFSSHVWETATSIGNRLFMIGHQYSGSFPAEPDDSTMGMIYFLSYDNEICSFNVNDRSLTTHYHCLYFNDEDCFNWLLMDEEAGDVKIDEHGQHNLLTYNNVVIRSNQGGARRGADVVTWSPKTPWLMFAKGYDATFKFIDPSSNSNTVYDLYIPQLSNKELCHATDDGWLVVVGDSTMFLFNPFTRVRIDIIPPDDEENNLVHSKYALSSSPTCQGCLLFCINLYMIFLFRLSNSNNHEGSRAVQKVYYNSDPPTTWPLSNPVYYNGLFYCLDMSGNVGTYDPLTNKWVVIDAHILFDPTIPVESCFLIKSNSGDLISVFMDRTHNPIGVYMLDSVSHHRWREVQDIGDNTLFVGPKACFIATAAKPEMTNLICPSKFFEDCGNLLLWHRAGVDVSTYNGPFTRRDRHMQLWFVPKGVGLGYDRVTGKNVVLPPFICPTH